MVRSSKHGDLFVASLVAGSRPRRLTLESGQWTQVTRPSQDDASDSFTVSKTKETCSEAYSIGSIGT